MIEFKVVLFTISKYRYLINMGKIQIRIRMDPELLPGSGTRENSELDPE